MHYYKLYGMNVATDMEFPQLVKIEETKEIDLVIEAGEVPKMVEENSEKKYEFGEKVSWLRNKTCYLWIENGKRIQYVLKEGGNPVYLRTYILGWGVSMLALQKGELAIHCSAVADDKGAVLIAGESGSGKSTLTTVFLERGYHLMADDMALVEGKDRQVMAKPAFPFQKLCRDAVIKGNYNFEELIYIDEEKDKFFVPYKGKFELEPVPIKAMIFLYQTDEDEVQAKQLQGMEKFFACANNLFLRKLLKEKRFESTVGERCLKMAAGIPIYIIGRPAQKDTIEEVCKVAFDYMEDC